MNSGENKRSHLQMIQNVIARMGSNSFSLKECAVGMIIAIYTFSGINSTKTIIITLVPLIVFGFLDAYYLMLERKFRCLYDDVRLKNEEDIDFNMNFNNLSINMKDLKKYCYFNIFMSKTVCSFYMVCIVVTLVIYLI